MIIRDVCPQCQSAKYKKNGHIHNGKQNYTAKIVDANLSVVSHKTSSSMTPER